MIRDADPVAVSALFQARGWTDGLPVVPPTLALVQEMVASTTRGATDVLGEVEPLRGVATVEKVAANAVMAGCRPESFPVVLAAVEAILDPAFNLRGVQTTDENVAPVIVVSGPGAERLGINAGYGALGPGWQANATIGRALRLVMNNVGGGWPGAVSLAGLGHPGRYTLCFGERTDVTAWPPLHVELGFREDQTVVTVLRAESVITVTGGLAELATVMGTLASIFTTLHGGRVLVVLAPHVAARLAAGGWTKDEVRRHLHAEGRVPVAAWRASWLHATVQERAWPAWVTAAEASGRLPIVEAPDHVTVVIAGADLAIPQHAYFPSWGHPPCRIAKAVVWPADRDARLRG